LKLKTREKLLEIEYRLASLAERMGKNRTDKPPVAIPGVALMKRADHPNANKRGSKSVK
jgi:hypothetical protein